MFAEKLYLLFSLFTNDQFLFFAVINNNVELAESAIAAGANINCMNLVNQTPLRLAASLGKKEIIDLLIRRNALLDLQDIYGNTALIIAVNFYQPKIIKKLLEEGADLSVENKDNETFCSLIKNKKELEKIYEEFKNMKAQEIKLITYLDENSSKIIASY